MNTNWDYMFAIHVHYVKDPKTNLERQLGIAHDNNVIIIYNETENIKTHSLRTLYGKQMYKSVWSERMSSRAEKSFWNDDL